jgi:hypothetical protein
MTRICLLYRVLERPKPDGMRRLLRRFPTVSPAAGVPLCARCVRDQRLGSFGIRSPPWPLHRTAIFGGEA